MWKDNIEENNMVNNVLIRFYTTVTLSPVRQLIPRLNKITRNMQIFVHVLDNLEFSKFEGFSPTIYFPVF